MHMCVRAYAHIQIGTCKCTSANRHLKVHMCTPICAHIHAHWHACILVHTCVSAKAQAYNLHHYPYIVFSPKKCKTRSLPTNTVPYVDSVATNTRIFPDTVDTIKANLDFIKA